LQLFGRHFSQGSLKLRGIGFGIRAKSLIDSAASSGSGGSGFLYLASLSTRSRLITAHRN
jgi:hypothetical protein